MRHQCVVSIVRCQFPVIPVFFVLLYSKSTDSMKEKLNIIKVGGKIVENPAALSRLISQFAQLPGLKMLVHGGGRTATDIAAQMGVETKMVEGRRVTDTEMLRVVTMVYGGLVNKNVVAQLNAAGLCALGLTGADMDVIRSHRRPVTTVDYGFVGDVDRVDGQRLAQLLESGVVPVMAPLTHDGNGQMLNTNADTIAGETAKALAPYFDVTLTYCFEFPGVCRMKEGTQELGDVIPEIDRPAFEALKADGTVSGGMIPKLENCLQAVDAGVSRVVITLADRIGEEGGTTIVRRGRPERAASS